MLTRSLSSPTLRRVPFSALPAFPDLFATYCSRYETVADFYAGDFRSVEARRAAADRAAAMNRDRETLVGILLDQNGRWGMDERTHAHIKALRDPRSATVVTGQQVGLFGGPLYTIYKIITMLQLTRKLQEETGRPAAPVFWLEGEDHDFEEIASVTLLRENEPVSVRYSGPSLSNAVNAGPAGSLVPGEDIRDLLSRIEEILPPTDFREPLLQAVRAAYKPDVTLLDAFARLIKALFPESGIVFINPNDARLKRMAAPLFRREIEDPEAVVSRMKAVSERLQRAGFHAQVHPRSTNLFLLEEGGRYAIDAAGDGFRLRGKDRQFTRKELSAILEQQPERFSPNVVFRPLMQDLVLPTAAYVAGPGEVSYFAQFKPVYEWAGVAMPLIYPRASVSLVETKVEKVLERYGLTVADMERDLERLFGRVALQESEVDLDEAFRQAARSLHEAVGAIRPVVEKVDPTLAKSAEATRAALVKEWERLRERVLKAEKRNHDEIRGRLEKALVNLLPFGKPQERVLSALYFLNKYSPELLRALEETLSLDTTEHQVAIL